MHIEYQLTLNDYLELNMFNMNHSKRGRNLNFLLRFVAPLFFAAYLIRTLLNFSWYLIGCVIVLSSYAAWVAFYVRIQRKMTASRLTRLFSDPKNARYLTPVRVTVTDDGLVFLDALLESKIRFNAIEEVAVTKDHIFLYLSTVAAQIIPLRAFPTDDMKDEFLAELTKRVNAPKTIVKDDKSDDEIWKGKI